MSQATGIDTIDDIELIVDTDAHVTERVSDLLPYIENAEMVRRIEKSNPGRAIFSVSNAAPPTISSYGSTRKTRERRTNESDVKLSEMGDFGIDYGILTPTLLSAIATINNPRFAVEIAAAYNRWITDEFLNVSDRFKASIVIAPQEPKEAAAEIDRWATDDNFVSVALPPGGLLPPAGHERYDPIYAAAEQHDLPVVLHGAEKAFQATFPNQYTWTETFAESLFLSHPFEVIWNLMTMVYRGVTERFPDLRVVIQESGISYIPFVKWRMDDIYLENSGEVPRLDSLPSEYIDESYYFTSQPLGHVANNPQHLSTMFRIAGPNSIMYSSDIPHATFDTPEEFFGHIRNEFEPEQISDMMGGTAREVFDLKL